MNTKQRGYFIRRGLPFLLDRPVRGTLTEVLRTIAILAGVTAALAVSIAILITKTISENISTIAVYHIAMRRAVLDAGYIALTIVTLFTLYLLGKALLPTLRQWSRVSETLPMMLTFVALSFLLSDTWRIIGGLPWWRLIVFAVIYSIVSLLVLFWPAVDAAREGDASGVLRDVKLLNLRLVVTILIARRILISGLVVSLVLFAFGVVILNGHSTIALMGGQSLATVGWYKTFGVVGRQFFLSEALAKVSVGLGGIAAAFFVLTNAFGKAGQNAADTDVTFVRQVVERWLACQLPPTEAARQPPGQPEQSPG